MLVSWETARNSCKMYDDSSWDEYLKAGQSDACRHGSRDVCERKRIEQLPCTCNDEQYQAVLMTGQGYSATCLYHMEWAKERRRLERGL